MHLLLISFLSPSFLPSMASFWIFIRISVKRDFLEQFFAKINCAAMISGSANRPKIKLELLASRPMRQLTINITDRMINFFRSSKDLHIIWYHVHCLHFFSSFEFRVMNPVYSIVHCSLVSKTFLRNSQKSIWCINTVSLGYWHDFTRRGWNGFIFRTLLAR